MTESELFVREVQDNKMTPINILNWYRNFYRTENNNTEQGIMVAAINELFKRLVETGASRDERVTMSNEDYILKYKNKEQNTNKLHETSNKSNDSIILTNKKFINLINLIQSSINNHIDITYDLDLFKDELQEENNGKASVLNSGSESYTVNTFDVEQQIEDIKKILNK